MKFNCFFKAQQEPVGQDAEGSDILGYKLGPNDVIVQTNKVVDVLQVDPYHLILYITDDQSLASKVKDWPEFMGFGYTDIIMRLAQGLSNVTLSDIEYITGAHFYLDGEGPDGEGHFGNVKDWKAAGSPANVWFGQLREIMGVNLQ